MGLIKIAGFIVKLIVTYYFTKDDDDVIINLLLHYYGWCCFKQHTNPGAYFKSCKIWLGVVKSLPGLAGDFYS